MKKEIQKLLDSDISSYKIGKATGVSNSIIQRLRSGERKIGNLTLDTAEKLYNLSEEIEDKLEEKKMSYVVNLDKHDKDVSVTTKEGDMYFEYFIKPEYLKDVEYLVDLIKDENLDSLFYGEEITDNEPLTFDYTIEEVETFLEKAK